MYTGRAPQRTGVVSTIWFDRRALKVRTMISWRQQRINQELAAHSVPTLFDYVKAADKTSLSCMLIVNKGADWQISSNPFFWGNASALGLIKGGRLFPHKSYTDPKTISAFLNGHLLSGPKSLQGLFKRSGELPDLMVVQLLGMDLDSHFPSRHFVKQKASMDSIQKDYVKTILDPQIGRLISFFKSTGTYQNTIFFLVSQQGAIKIEKHLDDNLLARILEPDFKIPDASTVNRLADAVIMPGACTKEVYLKNRRTGNWQDPPRLIADVKPAIDLLLGNNKVKEALNALVVRQYPGERNEGLREDDQWWHFDWKAYNNGDRSDHAFLDALKPLTTMAGQFELKGLVVQGLNRQYTRATAPDIKLINKKGEYYVTRSDKYGHHGSYYPEDLMVSFWLAGPGLSSFFSQRHVVAQTTSTLDLVPMTCHLLGIPIPPDLDGKDPLADLK
jgi:arylsulfatase A-like enzyme